MRNACIWPWVRLFRRWPWRGLSLIHIYLYEYTGDETYGAVCKEWAQWVMDSLPKTKEGGFQHITSDTLNDGELWDDTLFMTVLVLANMGRILGRQDYTEDVYKRQVFPAAARSRPRFWRRWRPR